MAPGVTVAASVMAGSSSAAAALSACLMGAAGPAVVPAIPLALLGGVLLNNVVTLPPALKPGLDAAAAQILRAGVVCVGFKLRSVGLGLEWRSKRSPLRSMPRILA